MNNRQEILNKVQLQFERLKRHYDASVKTYDDVSLLDLSHSLRIWADLKEALSKELPAFKATIAFRTALPAKKVLRLAKGRRHIFAYMPGGVITRASKGEIIVGPDMEGASGEMTCGAAFKFVEDGAIHLKNFCYMGVAIDESLSKAIQNEDVSRINYSQWMAAEAVRIGYVNEQGNLVCASITRDDLIRRVANALDGSHPSVGNDRSHELDEAVQVLMLYKMGGVPLPYFILLKIAQDIVEHVPRLLQK
jgi:hypothetical protein